MKHLWDLIAVEKVTRQRFREMISIPTLKNRIGRETYILNDEEAYITAT